MSTVATEGYERRNTEALDKIQGQKKHRLALANQHLRPLGHRGSHLFLVSCFLFLFPTVKAHFCFLSSRSCLLYICCYSFQF